MTQIANLTVEQAMGAFNDIVNHPLAAAFVGPDGHMDLPLLLDHTDGIKLLVNAELWDTLAASFRVLQMYLFDDETCELQQSRAQALANVGIVGELAHQLRHYPNSEMYVIPSKIGKIIIG
jgi:hypothetical protein